MREISAKLDTRLWNLDDMVRKLGLDTDPGMDEYRGTYREAWYIRQVNGGVNNVRVCIFPNDGYRVELHYLDRHYVAEWSATFSGSTPNAVIRAAIRAAILR